MFAASVWIAFDSFDSALRITAATMQATCWSGEAAIVRSGARHVVCVLQARVTGSNPVAPTTKFPQLAGRSSRGKTVGMLVLADIGTIRRGNTMLIMKDGHMVRYGF